MLRLLEMFSQFGPSAHNQFNSPTPVDIEEKNNQRAMFSWKILTVENENVHDTNGNSMNKIIATMSWNFVI